MEAQLSFNVTEQELKRTDRWILMASESKQYLKAKFIFLGGPWVSENTLAVFTSPGGHTETVQLSANGECNVPDEVLTKAGDLTTSLFYSIGESATEFRITTNPVKSYIHPTLTVLHGGES